MLYHWEYWHAVKCFKKEMYFTSHSWQWSVSISEIDRLWESVDWARNKGPLSQFKGVSIKLVKLLRESARALAEVALSRTSFLTPLNTLFSDFAEKDKFRGGLVPINLTFCHSEISKLKAYQQGIYLLRVGWSSSKTSVIYYNKCNQTKVTLTTFSWTFCAYYTYTR